MAVPANFKNNTKARKDSSTAKSSAPPKRVDDKDVPLHSNRNIFWNGVGDLRRGYNVVSKEHAEMWLTKQGIRVATIEEMIKEYNL